MADTDAVIDHHLASLASGDLDAILSDYADEAVVIGPDGAAEGLDAIRALFEGLLEAMPPGRSELLLLHRHVIDGMAYITWSATAPALNIPIGSDTFVLEDGKIRYQTFWFKAA